MSKMLVNKILLTIGGLLIGVLGVEAGTISGRVYDGQTGTPHSNLLVRVWRNTAEVPGAWVRTDEQGLYQITLSGAGGYNYTIKPDYPAGQTAVPFSRIYVYYTGANMDHQDFAVATECIVSGRVITASSEGIQGVRQYVYVKSASGQMTSVGLTHSDSSGLYQLRLTAGADYVLSASDSGSYHTFYSISPTSVALSHLTQSVIQNFSVGSLATISGRILSGVGMTGLVGHNLKIVRSEPEISEKVFQSSFFGDYWITMAQGFTYRVVPSTLSGAFNEFLPASQTLENFTQTQTLPDFLGYRWVTVYGDVKDAMGVPLNGVTVSVAKGTTLWSAVTSFSGGYTLRALTGGPATLTAQKEGWTFTPSKVVTSLSQNVARYNFSATPVISTVWVMGTVRTSASAPISGVVLSIAGSGTAAFTTTGLSGTYTLTVPRGGSYILTPSKPGFTFSPLNRILPDLIMNSSNQNFTGIREKTPLVYSVMLGVKSVTVTPESYRPTQGPLSIQFDLASQAPVTVTVQKIEGSLLKPPARTWTMTGLRGANRLEWNGQDTQGRFVSLGTYVCTVTSVASDGQRPSSASARFTVSYY